MSALRSGPANAGWTLLYAPGAGSNLQDPFGVYLARTLETVDVACLRFQFPYSEQKRKVPDRTAVLEATWKAALAAVRPSAKRIVASGRSMGGRIASMVVAAGQPVDALVLFAYPLYPPGRREQQRTEHLGSIMAPTLFCSGDRDSFGSVNELKAAATLVPGARFHVLRGADHGFSVLKASGRKREDVWDDAIGALLAFLAELQ